MSYEALKKHLEAKEARKRKTAKNKHHGIPAFSEDTAEVKAEMAKPDGFHNIVRELDRVCQDCQNFHGRTRKAGKHADHVIPQRWASYEEKTQPKYGTGVCAECNELRKKGVIRACMLRDGDVWFQVRWSTETGVCVRRTATDEGFGAWLDIDLQHHWKDGYTHPI